MAQLELSRLQSQLAVARGERKADLVLANARLINIFSGAISLGSVAISDGHIVGIGEYEAFETIDLKGAFLAPGFIDGHIHIESSKLTPPRFAEAVVPHGTTTVIADPHEIANVWGIEGLRFMFRQSKGIPLDVLYMLPSCVPATSMETSGARLSADDLLPLLDEQSVLGIAELMNFPGAYSGDPDVLSKALLAGGTKPIDGHSPGLRGKLLAAYLVSGPSTDHECNLLEEAEEKLAMGMRIMIREGSTARNLAQLLPLVNQVNERRCMFVTDDRRPGDLIRDGHLDNCIRLAVKSGLDAVTAIRMVSLNAAEAFGLLDRGGIRPGWKADLIALEDLESFQVRMVWKNGVLVAQNGRPTFNMISSEVEPTRALSVSMIGLEDFQVLDKACPVRVIGIVSDSIVTESIQLSLPSIGGMLTSSLELDVAKIAVIERHTGSGRVAVAFVKGLGLKEGAIGSTVAHDSHNIIVAGMDDNSMLTAVEALIAMGGGQVTALYDHILSELCLPIGGLMCDRPVEEVATKEDHLIEAARRLGSELSDPFMALSFLALPVIPALKLTDYGLVDVDLFKHVPLYVS